MARTWLELCQAAAAELAQPQPATITGGNAVAAQFGALANRIGDMLMRRREWTALQTEWVLTPTAPLHTTCTTANGSPIITNVGTLAGVTADAWLCRLAGFVQSPRVVSVDTTTQCTFDTRATITGSDVPAVFYRDMYEPPAGFVNFIGDTGWDRTRRWRMLGPVSGVADEAARSGAFTTVFPTRFRKVGRKASSLRLWPPPDSDPPATLVWEYQTSYWAQDDDGTPRARFTANTDVSVFPDDLFVLGIQWLFLRSKGMDFQAQQQDWERAVMQAASSDGGGMSIALDVTPWDEGNLWNPAVTTPSTSSTGGDALLADDDEAILV